MRCDWLDDVDFSLDWPIIIFGFSVVVHFQRTVRWHQGEASHPNLHPGKRKYKNNNNIIKTNKQFEFFTLQMENQCGEFKYEHESLAGCILTCQSDGCNAATKNLMLPSFATASSFFLVYSAITLLVNASPSVWWSKKSKDNFLNEKFNVQFLNNPSRKFVFFRRHFFEWGFFSTEKIILFPLYLILIVNKMKVFHRFRLVNSNKLVRSTTVFWECERD